MRLFPSRYGWLFTSPKGVGRGKRRQVGAIRVVPLLAGSGQSGLEGTFIPNPWQASVFADLVGVDSVENHAAQSLGLGTTPRHRLCLR
jgi:hypothetical protein